MNSSRRSRQASAKQEQMPSAASLATPRKRIALRLPSRSRPLPPIKTGERVRQAVSPETTPFQCLYRGSVMVAALLLLAWGVWNGGLSAAAIGAVGAVSGFVLLTRLVPVAWTRERPLTFTAPIVFAVTLWISAETAALGVLLACLLHARFGRKLGDSRGYVRFQGAQLAVSAFIGSAALRLTGARLGLPAHGTPLLTDSGATPLRLLAAATLGALAFLAANGLLTAGANLNTLRSRWHLSRSHGRLFALALVYTLGMLPVVLLAPLGPALGLMVGLPLLLLLTLSGQVTRLTLEVGSLRGQLETAEAMGRASIADPETDIDPNALLQRFLSLAQALVTAERAIVWTMNQETGELTPTAALPDMGVFAGQKAMFGEGLIGHAAARIRPRLVADAARDSRRGRREAASGAWLLYPIIVHARLLGVAQWVRPVSHPFTQADVARLASLVPQAAVALENVLVREQMHSQAATDGLTGLWNHRRMQELLSEEVRRSARYHRALSVLMLDVDSFKTFNDAYGHPQGDQLLRSIAMILRTNVRTVDHAGRYGGEEFIVILPETAKDDACRLAERIRSAVESQACIVVDDQLIRRTISVGVAAYPEDALNPGELVQRADEALYRAKRSGKNCVIWA